MLTLEKSVCSKQRIELGMLEKKSIIAIVVTYHPDNSFADRFKRLSSRVRHHPNRGQQFRHPGHFDVQRNSLSVEYWSGFEF